MVTVCRMLSGVLDTEFARATTKLCILDVEDDTASAEEMFVHCFGCSSAR